MLRFLKTSVALGLLMTGLPVAHGFSLLGPAQAFQTEALGYSRLFEITYPDTLWTIDHSPDFSSAPMNIGEFYRWNVPTLYYAYDQSFLYYFQEEGVRAVDSAFAAFNVLTNVDYYSSDLSEFPVDEGRFNSTAAALHLFDLKSATMEMIIRRLGLADPERWTWCLRDRIIPPGAACPVFNFQVIQRNFDPVTFAPSKFVNGNLYTYQWLQFCGTFNDRSDPVEVLVDPLQTYQTAVASAKISIPNTLYYGLFHTTLTRDDVGGLRYLYSTNRVAVETAPPDTLVFTTNPVPALIVSSNLTLLAAQALTNDAPTLSGLFPGLTIIGTTNFFTNIYTTNITVFFTNFPWDPFGTPAHAAFITNVTATVATYFHHTFGNLLSVVFGPNGWTLVPLPNIPPPKRGLVTLQTDTIALTNEPWLPVGTNVVTTNTTFATYPTNEVLGEFLLLPTNLCSASILYSQLTLTNSYTNVIFSATNAAGTNAGSILSLTQTLITYSTNHVFVISPVTCDPAGTALRQGLQKISFVRHDYDSLFNRFWNPVTNIFRMTAITNNAAVTQWFLRVATRPDFLIAAADLAGPAPDVRTVDNDASVPVYVTTNAVLAGAGPGTIQGPITLTFNNTGPLRLNTGPNFVDEQSAILYFTWASFDGSTNAPVIYGGSQLTDLSNDLFFTVTPPYLPAGRQGVDYNQDLNVTGGVPPYTWGLGPGSPDLPDALMLTQDASDSSHAFLSGPLLVPNTYTFWFQVTDATGRFVNVSYVLLVNPQ